MMRAVHFNGDRIVFRTDCSMPKPDVGEVRIRVLLAGICSTDLEIIKGYFGFQGILGHELVGVVDLAADPDWVGRRVVSSINFAPSGMQLPTGFGLEHLKNRQVLGILNRDGAMADWVAVPQQNLFLVPDNVSDQEAVLTEPLAAALRIAQQLKIRPDSRIAVIGAGRLGMLIAGVLSLGGAFVTVLARQASSLELATRWGIESALANDAEPQSFDLVVEATGNPEGLRHAMQLARPCGTIVLKSTYADRGQVDLTPIVVNELRVQGSRCGPFGPALRLLERKSIAVQDLIDHEYPAEDALLAFEHAAKPGVRKILLRFHTQN